MWYPSVTLVALVMLLLQGVFASGPEVDKATIGRKMLQDYRTHREALAARMRSTSFSPQTAAKKEILMKQYFYALSNALPEKQPELLQKINDLRQAGYRFGASVDPGLHVPFGTPWDPTRFGPYPAKRLAEGAYEGLDRSTLNKIFGNPRHHFVMPPRTTDGLPLVVLRHTNRGHVGSTMVETLTGRLGETNLMSLWSPILSDGRRFTSVLYGIVSFDARYTFEVQQHLRAHARSQNVDDYAFMYTFRSALESAPH
ncbi:hypothetical protein OOU_Y34scaffold01143g1 [Pyricularia oryzae Y34]|uniref:Uncharacterized protein n=1 Tax=Pyricularia oryzae (strain Y34) TaxID=1143189 RepID=A0AA97NLR7_PYRO3|nr:hypothetical protein OOU_Y34scaffold01143g1 [Pyricularia oryzae Y34]